MTKIKFNKIIAFCMSLLAVFILFACLPNTEMQVSAESSSGDIYD